jgi:hypothetical protein
MSIHSDRRIIADNIYNDMEIPDSIVIESTSGWEHNEGGNEKHSQSWCRVLYVQNPENEDLPTFPMLLSVTFYPNSVEVESVFIGDTRIKVPAPY